MSHITQILGISDIGHTEDDAPLNLGIFELPDNSSGLYDIRVFAIRLSDGACKAWQTLSLLKKVDGVPSISENIPTPVNVFASSADATALSGTTISFYNDDILVGVTVTGLPATEIDWAVEIFGRSTLRE